jgi:hypothetical protein
MDMQLPPVFAYRELSLIVEVAGQAAPRPPAQVGGRRTQRRKLVRLCRSDLAQLDPLAAGLPCAGPLLFICGAEPTEAPL